MRLFQALPILIGLLACHGRAGGPPLLREVADVPLPGAASRFDYASLDAGSSLLYLNHMGAGEVVIFDTRARRVVAVLKGFPRCTGILAVPSLGRIFVSAAGEGKAVAVDAKSRAVLARMEAGRFPDGIAYESGAHLLFVSDESGRAVTVLDPVALREVSRIPIGGEAGNTQADEVDHLVYTNDQTHGDLVVIDPVKLQITARIPLGLKGNHGLCLDAPRHLAFIASEDEARLLAMDLRTRKVAASFKVGKGPDVLAFDPGTRRLFVASESGVLSVFHETDAGLAKEGGLFAGPDAHVAAVDPSTHLLYLPLKDLGGRPVLRIMAVARP
jgi:DNA-binding beta-propeller fold protein YncE